MKKILFIAMNLGDTAPGIVYEKLLTQMSNSVECSIICPNINSSKVVFKNVVSLVYKKLSFRIEEFLYTHFGTNIIDFIWSRRVMSQLDKSFISNFDCIVSLVSSGNYAPIVLGDMLALTYNKPWAIYTVDAIPSPLAWKNKPRQHKAIISFLKKKVRHATGLFAANPMMLSYVQSVFAYHHGNIGIVYTPYDKVLIKSVHITHNGFIFLYTGNIYGIRKIDSLLQAFRNFLVEYPKSKLVFVGNVFSDVLMEYEDLIDSEKVVLYPFTNDLSEHYGKADVLLDIGAAVDNDVFLSSKIVNYLAYKKPIICITQEGSPARAIFKDVKTIIHCHHNEKEIEKSLKKSVTLLDSSFEDREVYLKNFSAQNVAKKFTDDIFNMIG